VTVPGSLGLRPLCAFSPTCTFSPMQVSGWHQNLTTLRRFGHSHRLTSLTQNGDFYHRLGNGVRCMYIKNASGNQPSMSFSTLFSLFSFFWQVFTQICWSGSAEHRHGRESWEGRRKSSARLYCILASELTGTGRRHFWPRAMRADEQKLVVWFGTMDEVPAGLLSRPGIQA
jgi:hypothetical protein